MEAAILNHLRQTTSPNVGQTRKRVKRTLAECLTSEEIRKRMNETALQNSNSAIAITNNASDGYETPKTVMAVHTIGKRPKKSAKFRRQTQKTAPRKFNRRNYNYQRRKS